MRTWRKRNSRRLYSGLVGAAGAFAGTSTLYIVGFRPRPFVSLAIGAIIAVAVAAVLGGVLPRKCDKIGKRLSAEEE